MVDSKERRRRSGDKDAGLIDGVVRRIELPKMVERSRLKWKKQRWSDALVDRVLGKVNHKQWYHAISRISIGQRSRRSGSILMV